MNFERDNSNIWGWGVKDEQALSEVIGFLMIVALLAMLFSMYLLYVVPLQGRDTEIAHMDQVKEQFTGIFLDINSLIVNQKLDYPIQRTISLGSGQGGMSGAFSILPMQTYTGSSGTLRVDTVDPALGMITFRLRGTGSEDIVGPPNPQYYRDDIIDPTDSQSRISIKPYYFNLNYHVANPANTSDTIYINSTNWSVIARVIPHYDSRYVNVTSNSTPDDLTLTVLKEGNISIDNLTIAKYVESNTDYPINLYDWGYGLADSLQDSYNLSYRVNEVAERGPFPIGQIAYSESPIFNVEETDFPGGSYDDLSHPLSIFEYQSNNKNWINQYYQYQWGTLFVNQADGAALMVQPPLSIEMDVNNNVINIDITDTIIQTHNPNIHSSSISGTQNNPVIITLDEVNGSINDFTLLDGISNAKYLTLTASGFDTKEKDKWKGVFTSISDNAIRYSDHLLGDFNINVTEKPLVAGDTSVSLVIAWDGNPAGFNLAGILADPTYPTLQDVIDEFNDGDGTNDIDENNLKIEYKRADLSISLYNIGQ